MDASLITPLLTNDYPWFIAHNLEAEDDSQVQIFNNIHDPLSHYICRIPELQGKRVRGCFHGWMILVSHDKLWSLWNPATSKSIRLPPLIILKDGGDPNDHIDECCLSSPPNDPDALLMLTIMEKPIIIFCRLGGNCKLKKLRWTEMTYANQLKNLGVDGVLRFLSCCNGKVYACSSQSWCFQLIQVDILVKDKQVEISLSVIRKQTQYYRLPTFHLLKGTCTGLFWIGIGTDFGEERLTLKTIKAVYLLKLDMNSMTWHRMNSLEGGIITVDLEGDLSIVYNPAIASELGGYIHFLGEKGKTVYSYHVKDRTISLSSMPCLVRTSRLSEWAMLECRRLKGDVAYSKQEEDKLDNEIMIRSDVGLMNNECHLFSSIPLHILQMIMEFCVGVEYLKFRATCKRCHLAAPLSNKTTRWHTYSPWLMVFDKHHGIITFTDPIFGDKYFIKYPQINIREILHSRDGWLLLRKKNWKTEFFNPFTNLIIKLPRLPYLETYCFSAPPTSPDCIIVGFLNKEGPYHVFIFFVGRNFSWRPRMLDFGGDDPSLFRFPTFHGNGDVYGLCDNGGSVVFKDIAETDYSWETVVNEAPCQTSCSTSLRKHFLAKCDLHLFLVIVGELGESIEVFKSNDREEKWEKIYCLGKYMIYICDTTCMCIEAETPKMENKIYFPRLDSKNGNIVFYSLETCRYHTFDGEESFGDFFGTKHHPLLHTWIEPSWS